MTQIVKLLGRSNQPVFLLNGKVLWGLFFIAKNGKIMNSNEGNKLQVNWVFSNVSKNGGAHIQFLGQYINQKISTHLASGQYRMHAYISDSSGPSISLSAPFVIY